MSETIQIYATNVDIDPSGMDSVLVTLEGVDVSNVVSEFTTSDVLDSLDFSDVSDFYIARMKDE